MERSSFLGSFGSMRVSSEKVTRRLVPLALLAATEGDAGLADFT